MLPVEAEKKTVSAVCVEKKNRVYEDTDEQQKSTLTWGTIEINKRETVQDSMKSVFEQKCNDLFRGYIGDFMKIKLETSLWQKDYRTKEEYAAIDEQNMAIELDVDKIEDNSGYHLNLFEQLWGKFGRD